MTLTVTSWDKKHEVLVLVDLKSQSLVEIIADNKKVFPK